MSELLFRVTEVSVGSAGLASRPSVWDIQRQRTVKVYRNTPRERELAQRAATVLNFLARREHGWTTSELRARANTADWDFDPRTVVRSLERIGYVQALWIPMLNETKWSIK